MADKQNNPHDHAIKMDQSLNRAFTVGIIINLVYILLEFVAGIVFDSVSLMSDAGHNLSDVVGLALAMMAFKFAKLKPSNKYTYGLKKSTVIISLVNACILLIAIGVIFYGSISKLINPRPIEGLAVAIVAGVGVLINGYTAFLLLKHQSRDLNAKGAYLHMIADTLISVGVVISGVVIHYTGWSILDPIIGMLVAVVILISTWSLLRDSIRLSVDGVPIGLSVKRVIESVMALDGRIIDMHHAHIWALSTTENAMTAHIVVESTESMPELKKVIKTKLNELGIEHITLEFELPDEREESCLRC